MAQPKLNSFFQQRKGIRDGHAAKRRRLDASMKGLESDVTGTQILDRDKDLDPDLTKAGNVSSQAEQTTKSDELETSTVIKASKLAGGKKNNQTGRKSSRLRSKLSKDKDTLSSQKKLTTDYNFTFSLGPQITKTKTKDSDSESPSTASPQVSNSGSILPTESMFADPKSIECQEEITSVDDDHVSLSQEGMTTPRKRIITEDTLSQGPVTSSRRRKTAVRKMISENKTKSTDICKKLDLTAAEEVTSQLLEGNQVETTTLMPMPTDGQAQNEESTHIKSASETKSRPSNKSNLLAAVSEISETHEAISPLATTPEHEHQTTSAAQCSTPKLHNLSEKLQALSKMNGKALKNRLKQKGLLQDCREKVKELAKDINALKSQSSAPAEPTPHVETEEKDLPAYQRFEYLAKKGPPTLSLPYTYRLLENTFQAMDTVVCMLHNRSEICTFSKLKSAVQTQTRKNFEEKTVGQIKTVVPNAYFFRQEKNFPTYGQKASGYQLTVEANLQDQGSNTNFTKDGKPSFSIKHIQARKAYFKHRLLHFVRQHHKKFLESLNPPLSIPDSKLSRWHPKFRLDEVPGIPASDLPQPPDAKVCRSAKDVLEIMQKGKINSPRVEQALQRVVAETNASSKSNVKIDPKSSPSKDALPSSPISSSSKVTTSSLKGIPPALLAKIRAKEARRMEEAMTRDPAEDKKTKMMSRLPEIIRILRSYFVTEKKAALPLATVFKKLEDSYKSGMALSDIEQHVELLKELAPEFVSVVEVKKGKYLKLDKNVDATAVSSRISNLVKTRQ